MSKQTSKNLWLVSLCFASVVNFISFAMSTLALAENTDAGGTPDNATDNTGTVAAAQKLPAMSKMSDADTTVTLFGTMHAQPN